MAAAAAAPGAIPSPGATTFMGRLSDTRNDPLGGAVEGLNHLVRGNLLRREECMAGIVEAAPENVPVLIGFAPTAEEPDGALQVLVGAQRFTGIPGQPSPWNGRTFAFNTEVYEGVAGVVELTVMDFELSPGNGHSTNMTGTLARTAELLQALPEDEIYLAPLENGDANVVQGKARLLQVLPMQFVPLVIGREGLTRRQTFDLLAPAIQAAGLEDALSNLCAFLKLSVTRGGAAHSPRLGSIECTVPRPDSTLVRFTKQTLHRLLPALSMPRDPNNVALVAILERQANDAAEAREREAARQEAARAPKTVSDLWTAQRLQDMCLLTQSATASSLPPVFNRMAAVPKEQRRVVLQECLRETAISEGHPDAATIVLPELALKVWNGEFAAHDGNDFNSGLNPFQMIVRDQSRLSGGPLTDALEAAKIYDLVTSGGTTISYKDAKDLGASTAKAILPTNYFLAGRMVQAFTVLCINVFGATSAAVKNLREWNSVYMNNLQAWEGLLARYQNKGPTLLLRQIQMSFQDWFRTMETATAYEPPPKLDGPLRQLLRYVYGPFSEIPVVHAEQLDKRWAALHSSKTSGSSAGSSVSTLTTESSSSSEASRKTPIKSEAVFNLAYNPEFEKYKAPGKSIKSIMKKDAKWPSKIRVKDADGKEIEVVPCLPYHIQGKCNTTCGRANDHQAHEASTDQQLLTWAAAALEPQA